MSSRIPAVLLCAWAFATCGKEPSQAPAASTTGSTDGGRARHNPFAPSESAVPAAPPTTVAAGPESPAVAPREPSTAPGAPPSAPPPAETKPAFPGTRADGKQAFPMPGAPAGTTGPAAPGGTTAGIPGLPGGVVLPSGLPPEATAMVNQMMGDVMNGGMPELEERPGLPNWRKLAALLPDRLGEFTAEEAAAGTSMMVMGMSTTTATRNYRATDGRTAEVTLLGGDVAALSAMEFAFPLPDEVTPEHISRTIQVAGKPAAVEWSKDGGRAEARTLVADKFSVLVVVRPTSGVEPVQALLQALDLAALARIP